MHTATLTQKPYALRALRASWYGIAPRKTALPKSWRKAAGLLKDRREELTQHLETARKEWDFVA